MIPATSRLEQLALTYHLGRCRYVVCRGIGCPAVLGLIALLERASAPDWQPIDTAPKDGTLVLVYDKSWCGGGPRISATSWVAYRHKEDGALEWRVKGGFSGVSEPTHWMPILKGPRS